MNLAHAFDLANANYNKKHPVTVITAGVVYKGKEYSTETITAMREWVKDCKWADIEGEDIDELSPFTILAGIEQHVEGGINEFITNMM